MNTLRLCGETLLALPSGALHWPARGVLCVSDLHLGKAERLARRGGALLPPYEVDETLDRLAAAIAATLPAVVLCLGDSFDDLAAAPALAQAHHSRLAALQAGRDWIWIEGNHDPAAPPLAGRALPELALGPLTFRHIAKAEAAPGEVSGHYHPKAALGRRGGGIRRPCFLIDGHRLILPAFGAYTGGLDCRDPEIAALMGPGAQALLTGPTPARFPLART